jgi:Holliday junction DNA helicase RuvB
MDDFTVRAEDAHAEEVPEDITGAAGFGEHPLDPEAFAEDDEPTLRPRSLDEFIGQEALKKNLRIFVEAAKQRGEALDHILLAGPPGLGKTSLCRILAEEMEVGLRPTSGPTLERAGDMAAILTSLEEGDFLFIDEIHRLNRQIEEVLYPAMEDYAMDIVLGQGPSARTIRMDLPRFTLVGATTRTGLMTKPLLDRFGFSTRLDYYGPQDLEKIVVRNAKILGIPITDAGASQLARRSRGNAPRRQPAPQARPRLRPGGRRRQDRRGDRERRAGDAGRGSPRPRQGRPRLPRPRHRQVRRAVLWGSVRSPSHSARRATPSRTSTSPTCCRAA